MNRRVVADLGVPVSRGWGWIGMRSMAGLEEGYEQEMVSWDLMCYVLRWEADG